MWRGKLAGVSGYRRGDIGPRPSRGTAARDYIKGRGTAVPGLHPGTGQVEPKRCHSEIWLGSDGLTTGEKLADDGDAGLPDGFFGAIGDAAEDVAGGLLRLLDGDADTNGDIASAFEGDEGLLELLSEGHGSDASVEGQNDGDLRASVAGEDTAGAGGGAGDAGEFGHGDIVRDDRDLDQGELAALLFELEQFGGEATAIEQSGFGIVDFEVLATLLLTGDRRFLARSGIRDGQDREARAFPFEAGDGGNDPAHWCFGLAAAFSSPGSRRLLEID